MCGYKKRNVALLVNLIFLSVFTHSLFGQYAGDTGVEADPFLIATAEQLNEIGQYREHWDNYFKQTANIDLSAYTGEQFNIIGIEGNGKENFPFSGTFDGNGYEIRNFTYQSAECGVAIFELVDYPGELRNITMVNPLIDCPQSKGVAALVFALFNGIIDNCRVLGGTISGGWAVGGLVSNYWTQDAPNPGAGTTKIINCHVTANISCTSDFAGGLLGISHGRIYRCSSAGSVTGKTTVGGLISQSGYWAKWNTLEGDIRDCYSTCNVSGNSKIGGLVGETGDSTKTSNCYATGEVTGTSSVGGLVGINKGSVSHSFWDIKTSGASISDGGKGLSTSEMQNPAAYQNTGWDLVNVWKIDGGSDYPKLRIMNDSTKIRIKAILQK